MITKYLLDILKDCDKYLQKNYFEEAVDKYSRRIPETS